MQFNVVWPLTASGSGSRSSGILPLLANNAAIWSLVVTFICNRL